MIIKLLLIGIVCSSLCISVFAQEPQETTTVKDTESTALSRVTGRICLTKYANKEYLLLIASEGKQYALIGKIADEEIKSLEDLGTKRFTLAGIKSGEWRETANIRYFYDEGRRTGAKKTVLRYREFEVVSIEKIEKAKKDMGIVSPITREKPLTSMDKLSERNLSQALMEPSLNLRKIKGRVTSCNLGKKALIPTMEIEYAGKKEKYSLIIIVPGDTEVRKINKNTELKLMPTAIKINSEVDVWYKQRDDQNFAHSITILN